MWSDVQEGEPSASWAELPENGWGALMGWAAGRDNLRRCPSSDAGRTVTGYIEDASGRTPFEEPFTAADREGVDDDIDMYLGDAGVPPRPRGFVWMIRVPDGSISPGAFLSDVDGAVLRAANSVTHPKQWLPVFTDVLRDFYARG
ncbi:DUF5956 family protein [Arthrobacter sp. U41]|uniref:DUF5956 family protein n=1 Tax=Arthrobacter sp. U41 TaxID=1849032 RepID=UPI0011A638BC|nr:DUF5956 family protein [Arthrobacter sp. U41]